MVFVDMIYTDSDLHRACYEGNLDIVKSMIDNGDSIESCNKQQSRPIHAACVKNHIDIVKYLIDKKCDIEARDKHDTRPIHLARDKELIYYLIDAGCNLNVAEKCGTTPFLNACLFQDVETIKYLIEKGCDINATNIFGENGMQIACFNESQDITKYFLEQQMYIGKIDKWGNTLLHYFCASGSLEGAKYLVDRGHDIDTLNNERQTAVEYTATHFRENDVIMYLISLNCDINIRNDIGDVRHSEVLMAQIERDQCRSSDTIDLETEYEEIVPTCNKCKNRENDLVLNCGHVSCTQCANSSDDCFMCKAEITSNLKLRN